VHRITPTRAALMQLTPDEQFDLEAYYCGTDLFAAKARKQLDVIIKKPDDDMEFVWSYLGHCQTYFEDDHRKDPKMLGRNAVQDLSVLEDAIKKVRGIVIAQTEFGQRPGKPKDERTPREKMQKEELS
jgi:hypothetical protein